MAYFLFGILFLVAGYFIYGRIIEKFLPSLDKPTPCIAAPDGVDCVPLPKWKNMLIQLLNIAGVGPVIGVILGIKFGKIALLIIPLGCVFMGAVHDFAGGKLSLFEDGANLPKIVRKYLGGVFSSVFSYVMLVLLLLVVAVFINVPANLIDKTVFPQTSFFWWAVASIFVYYIAATLFPVDKIIGRVYPFFGALLIIGSVAISLSLLVAAFSNPEILSDCAAFAPFKEKNPLFPCLFVTIACGIISGFHATQSPIVARTMTSEKESRATFYGMMILEGIIAMIWAAAALAIYNIDSSNVSLNGPAVLGNITKHFLGPWMGGVTVFAIVVLAVTSGDTALRSARLSVSEIFGVHQSLISKRIFATLPLIVIVAALLWWSNRDAKSFGNLWNYFAWGNQVLSVTTLMTASVWMLKCGKGAKALVTLIPGAFMSMVVSTFIFWAWPTKDQVWGIIPGGLSLCHASCAAAVVTALIVVFVIRRSRVDFEEGGKCAH
jgi:carbon starvation protein CstA